MRPYAIPSPAEAVPFLAGQFFAAGQHRLRSRLGEVDLPQAAPGDHTPLLELFHKAIGGFIDAGAQGIVVGFQGGRRKAEGIS